MKEEITTQEIIGASASSKDLVKGDTIAYLLSSPSEVKLLIGNFVPVKECNRTVLKFKPFCSLVVGEKEEALNIWRGLNPHFKKGVKR